MAANVRISICYNNNRENTHLKYICDICFLFGNILSQILQSIFQTIYFGPQVNQDGGRSKWLPLV